MLKWLKERKERKNQEEHDRGFGWAMTRYLKYQEPSYYLRDCIPDRRSDKTAFDEGVLEALDLLPDSNKEWQEQK